MSNLFSYLELSEIAFYGAIIILFYVLVLELSELEFNCVNRVCNLLSWSVLPLNYGYEEQDGPHVWNKLFPESKGNLQSPINIISKNAVVIGMGEPLLWTDAYHSAPDCLFICNNGHTVELVTQWGQHNRPSVCGGPLNTIYELHLIHFRWGANDEEGSEHTIDFTRYPLEMQLTFCQIGSSGIEEVLRKNAPYGLLVVSYLFSITPIDNPFLEPIITGLRYVRCPGTERLLTPFALSLLAPSFESNYFTYNGSLTYPPCREGVTWLVQSEPLSVSRRQVRKFRKMIAPNGTLLVNSRPVQNANNRELFFYD